jgi:hypothetical protein
MQRPVIKFRQTIILNLFILTMLCYLITIDFNKIASRNHFDY